MNTTHEKTLLLGWRSGATRALETLGQTPTCVIAPKDVPAARRNGFRGDLITVADPANVGHVLAGLERHSIDLGSFTAVGTNIESFVIAASVVGTLAGARCIPTKAAILLRDKVVQKSAARGAGLAVAACSTADTLADLPSDESAYPLVVKPLAGEGVGNTYLLQHRKDAEKLAAALSGPPGHGPWAVEEFIDGPELQLDGVVRGGRLLVLAVSRYLQNLIGIKDGGLVGTILLSPEDHPRMYDQATRMTTTALEVLGHSDGVFHLEAFDQGERLVFSECAGRVSGGVVREKLLRKLGVDLTAEWGRALLGIPPQIPAEPIDDLHYGTVNLNAPPGHILSFPSTAEVLARDNVVEASVEITAGSQAPDPTIASNIRAGRIVAAAASESAVETALRDTARWFTDHTTVS